MCGLLRRLLWIKEEAARTEVNSRRYLLIFPHLLTKVLEWKDSQLSAVPERKQRKKPKRLTVRREGSLCSIKCTTVREKTLESAACVLKEK